MNGGSLSTTVLAGGGLEAMIPSQTQPSTSKRKPMDELNPLGNPLKKTKKDVRTCLFARSISMLIYMLCRHPGRGARRPNAKVRVNPRRDAYSEMLTKPAAMGEEQPGGLFIVRAPTTRTTPSQDTVADSQPSRSAPIQPPLQVPPPSNASKPPSKKFKASDSDNQTDDPHIPSRQHDKGKAKEPPAASSNSTHVATVSRTHDSSENHRRPPRSTAPTTSSSNNPAFHFPPPGTPSHDRIPDSTIPIPTSETPQIEKNKMMRGEMPRRRSSVSRGKRASSSFENTGVISECEYQFHPLVFCLLLPKTLIATSCTAQPHTSVAESSFYKHIDVDLPEPQRAQQLLIWCSHRALTTLSNVQQSSSRSKGRSAGKDPPLSPDDLQVLKDVKEDVIRLLAEKKLDTNVFSPTAAAKPPQVLRENEQNVRNKEREVKFNENIQK